MPILDTPNTQAITILKQLSLSEKIAQMSPSRPFFPDVLGMLIAYNTRPIRASENKRLGLPGLFFTDGPRGVVMYHSTCFPVAIGRGASWDTELERRIGDAIGVEARTQGANFFAGVCINLLRHPAWGRAQETYGEDPVLLGEMGTALVEGAQRHVMACVKHFACNSLENTRFKINVHIAERTLREVYLPHFKQVIDGGVAAVMSAYNQVNDEYCGHHPHLLRQILKGEWNFQGFVISDFIYGIRNGTKAANGGLDIEMPYSMHYGKKLQRLVQQGRVAPEVIDEAVLRILRTKQRFAIIGEPGRYRREVVTGPEHRALAREAAQKSIVLLKNSPLPVRQEPGVRDVMLPLDPDRLQRLIVIGKLAKVSNIGDHGSSKVRPPYVITPLQGIQTALGPAVQVTYESGKDLKAATEAARGMDAAILIVGYTHSDEGEAMNNILRKSGRGGDRKLLTLHAHDEALIHAIAAVNPRCVVVIIGGSAVITEAWREKVPAILMAWYPGMEGGHAIADILFGKANPSARLPCTFPASDRQLPFFDPNALSIEYGYYHGYRLLEKNHEAPAYAFGYGLSYTTFEYTNLQLHTPKITSSEILRVNVAISNTGDRSGEETVQLYVGAPGVVVDRPIKELKAFRKISLYPGETKQVEIELSTNKLAYWDETQNQFMIEPGIYRLYIGPSSRSEDLISEQFEIILNA